MMSARAAFRLSALVLNPWFIFTQAPFAARKARGLIERLRVDLPAMNLSGMLGLIDLSDARLLVHQGKRAEARDLVERIKRRLLDAGIEHVPGPVMALAAEVERRA